MFGNTRPKYWKHSDSIVIVTTHCYHCGYDLIIVCVDMHMIVITSIMIHVSKAAPG